MDDLDANILNDLISLKTKKRTLLGHKTKVLVHYVNVSDNTIQASNEIMKYKNYIENVLYHDDIINIYVPTSKETHIERLIN